MNVLTGKRGSGRTTRMLFDAVSTGIGKHHYRKIKIFCTDPRWLRGELEYYFGVAMCNRIDLIQTDFLGLKTKTRGLEPESYYVDHHVYTEYLENLPHIQEALQGLHKYDL